MEVYLSYPLFCIILLNNIPDVYTRSLYLSPNSNPIEEGFRFERSLPVGHSLGDDTILQTPQDEMVNGVQIPTMWQYSPVYKPKPTSRPLIAWKYPSFNPVRPVYQSDFLYPDSPMLVHLGVIISDPEDMRRRENLQNFLKSRYGVTVQEQNLDEASPEIYYDFPNSRLGRKTLGRRGRFSDMEHHSGSGRGIVKKDNMNENRIYTVDLLRSAKLVE